jgi:hypothetical protein
MCITIVKTRVFSERKKVREHQNRDNAPYNNFIATTLNGATKVLHVDAVKCNMYEYRAGVACGRALNKASVSCDAVT